MRAVLLAAVACSAPARPVEPPAHPTFPGADLEPMPPVDVDSPVDPTTLLHAHLPSLEPPVVVVDPHYPIADAYGVSVWRDACESRGRPRVRGDIDELAAYEAAWCGDVSKRPRRLAALIVATTPGLGAAVRADLIAVIATTSGSRDAQAWFAEHDLHVTAEELAAVYDALDRRSEVVATLSVYGRPVTTDCVSLGRLAAADPRYADDYIRHAHARDPACREVFAYLTCPLVTGHRELDHLDTADVLRAAIEHEAATCAPILGDEAAYALALRDRWPSARDVYVWLAYVAAARNAPPSEQMRALLLAAARNAVRASYCSTEILELIHPLGDLDPVFATMSRDECLAFHRGSSPG